jgi:hypothetical protein
MSFAAGSIPVGATFAPSGGTAKSFVLLSDALNGTKWLVDEGAAYALRTVVNVNVVEPKANASAPAGYTQRRVRINIQKPKLLADNVTYTTNQITVELSCDPQCSNTDITALRSLAINIVNDSDFDNLWNNSSVG